MLAPSFPSWRVRSVVPEASPSKLVQCLLLVLAVTCCGCGRPASHSHEVPASTPTGTYEGEPPLTILCTTGQVADAIRHVAGEHAEVSALMGPGVDPHMFREKPSHVVALKRTDVVFYNGLHLEGKLVETLETFAKRKPVFAITGRLLSSKDSRLRRPPEFEGYFDPHVWHDALLWADCVDYAAEKLAEFDPDRAEDYLANAKEYRAELEQLHAEIAQQIESIPEGQRVLVTAHDAFGYFSKAYSIETFGLKGISTEDQADFQHMDEVRTMLVERKIPAVFVESSTPPRLVEQLIEECQNAGHAVRKGKELYSDALGEAGSGADNYTGMMRANVASIVSGLNPSAAE